MEDDYDNARETESQSESQLDSDYYEKRVHRKSVSFDLSGDERGKSDHERSHTPESSSQYYDSEQEMTSKRMPRKGILRASSPSSSNNSTLEKQAKMPEKTLPIVPTVARIKEIESPVHCQYRRSPSPARNVRSRSRSPPPPPVVERVPELKEIERENPFRDAFLHKCETEDDYTEMAKVISRSPNLLKTARQQFFSSKSSDDLLSTTTTTPTTTPTPTPTPTTTVKPHENKTKSLEKLNTGARPKIKPPPPPKPTNIKKADIVRNLALETFQNTDMGHGDFTVYEHDAQANTIHEIGSRTTTPTPTPMPMPTAPIPSPKLPVRILTRSISRPRESPPLPPVNFTTLPKSPDATVKHLEEAAYMEILPPPPPQRTSDRKHVDEHNENSRDNILLTEDEHRELMLSENELRNQLKKTIHQDDDAGVPEFPAPPLPLRGSSIHLVNELSSSNDTLDSWPVMHKKNHFNFNQFHYNNGLSLSTNYINSTTNTNAINTTTTTPIHNMQPQSLDTIAAAPLMATQLFPSAQILPVQYTQLPQPQQKSYTTIPKFGLGSYVLVPQTQFSIPQTATATPATIFLSSQGTQQLLQLQQQHATQHPQQQQQHQQQPQPQQPLVSDNSKQHVTTTPLSPSYTSMQFPSLYEVKTPNAFNFPPLPPTPTDNVADNYENAISLGFSNDTIASSTFSINSSLNSLPKTNNAAYYETAEEIYSIIQEDAIYSNTSFFDSRRSSDTSLHRLSLTSSTAPKPPPLPPKKPGGYMPAKYISKSQPDLNHAPKSPNNKKQTKLVCVGKETTV